MDFKGVKKNIYKRILEGFKIIFPLMLMLLVMGWILVILENSFKPLVHLFIPPQYYFPGLGLIVAMMGLSFLSLIVQMWVMRPIYEWFMKWISHIPIISSLYEWTGNLVRAFTSDDPHERGKPVIVQFGNVQLFGLLTNENIKSRVDEISGKDMVAVFIQMSYQIGGYTVIVERERIKELKMATEEMFTMVLTAALVQKKASVTATPDI
jgi:uncharacterized membrane protein